ncbi:MAG: response regulator [Tepidisphaerales bacterium]
MSRVYPPEAGRDVLLVEDEKRLRDMLNTVVHEMLFRCTPVGSAEAAMRHLEQKPVDIIMLDLNLPGMSGMELFNIIRKRWPEIRVIVLTGYGDLAAAKQAIHLDVVDFLTKPAALKDIELALTRAREKRLENWQPAPAPEPLLEEDDEDEPAGTGPVPVVLPHPGGADAPRSLDDIERDSIIAALHRHNGNRTEAAAELGISVRKLYYRLVEYQKQGYIQ